ncbi:hypothetical protein ASPWEDRAFT_477943 [Aspergillus wentii DTO 134E9]|uniref:Uncharacterized protein n=1 Tax=Aspergillus wentii DTO 134E9 TaxID=1073089 RepID=A0A1L9RIY8_ASPWE|nr:uncharacterized protein ASPWEDRAFT_477943 [Aspergillus wentii DTO 134E9]OJJ34807.1 hypothetical protein ASPWEDRAFT_477943 [Aspergillus wentii DTO 134E9]
MISYSYLPHLIFRMVQLARRKRIFEYIVLLTCSAHPLSAFLEVVFTYGLAGLGLLCLLLGLLVILYLGTVSRRVVPGCRYPAKLLHPDSDRLPLHYHGTD